MFHTKFTKSKQTMAKAASLCTPFKRKPATEYRAKNLAYKKFRTPFNGKFCSKSNGKNYVRIFYRLKLSDFNAQIVLTYGPDYMM